MNEEQKTNGITESVAEETTLPKQDPSPEENRYVYRWTYGAQRAHDEEIKKKGARRGGIVFACTMITAFLLVFGLLIGSLAFRDGLFSVSKKMATEEVAATVLPATVLIYASSNTSFGYGTGFFVRSDGYIVTNYHLVAGATDLSVALYPSEKTVAAEVIGYSVPDDIAVLKIEGSGYPTVKIGNSDKIHVGDVAIAIGNPAGISAPWTTTQGIISSTVRSVTISDSASIVEMKMIQTDAPVNPGNSGGPLCNDRAEVIGIVAQKLSDYESLGFAIPINGSMKIVNAIIATGSADGVQAGISRVRPAIGIAGSTIKAGEEFTYMGVTYKSPANGILVSSVYTGSGADGILKPGDIIVAIDRKAVSGMDELVEKLYTYKAGDTVILNIYPFREIGTREVRVKLGVAN